MSVVVHLPLKFQAKDLRREISSKRRNTSYLRREISSKRRNTSYLRREISSKVAIL